MRLVSPAPPGTLMVVGCPHWLCATLTGVQRRLRLVTRLGASSRYLAASARWLDDLAAQVACVVGFRSSARTPHAWEFMRTSMLSVDWGAWLLPQGCQGRAPLGTYSYTAFGQFSVTRCASIIVTMSDLYVYTHIHDKIRSSLATCCDGSLLGKFWVLTCFGVG